MGETDLDKSLEVLGTEYFQEGFRRPSAPKAVVYGKNHLQIGRKMDGSIYYLDIAEAFRAIILGATRCLEENTFVKTMRGNIKIKDLQKNDLVKSYNFEKKIFEWSNIQLYSKENEKELFEIELVDGRKVQASAEHTFFVKRNNQIIELQLKDINIENDEIVNFRRFENLRVNSRRIERFI